MIRFELIAAILLLVSYLTYKIFTSPKIDAYFDRWFASKPDAQTIKQQINAANIKKEVFLNDTLSQTNYNLSQIEEFYPVETVKKKRIYKKKPKEQI